MEVFRVFLRKIITKIKPFDIANVSNVVLKLKSNEYTQCDEGVGYSLNYKFYINRHS